MADKLGINTEGLDLSEAITKPYTITNTKPQTIKSMADLNKELKVTDQWEGISTQPIDLTKVEEAGVTLERAIQDLVVNVPATAAEMAGETIEHPIQKAATYTAEAMGFAKGSALAGKYITGAGRLATAGRVAGGLVGGAAGGVVALAPTFLSSGGAPLPQDNSKILVYGEDEPKEWKEVKEILNGAEYPVNSIAHDMLTWGARYKEARQALREYQASKQGIDPEYWSNQLLQGGVSIIPAIAVGKIAYGATAKAKTKQITDALTGETEKVLTNKARKQASETAVKAAQAFTTEQMSVDYIEGDIQDYIDKTGDLTLQGFNINSAEAAQAYTYGMLGNYIEFGLGGAEAVALGAWKRAGLNMSMKTGQAIAKTALEEGAEEGWQNITEFMFRKIDGTTNKTWGEALKESLQAALYGAGIGGAVGGTSYRIGRNNLAKIYRKAQPNITREQSIQMAEDTIENSAKALAPENAEARNIIKKNIDLFYQGNENVDEYDKEVMVDELMQSLQIKATRDGTTIAELPEIQKAVVDQIAWWVVGRPDEIVPDVQAILERQKQTEERVAELEAKQEKTEQEIDELDMLETQLEKAEEFKESLEQLRTLNAKMRAVKAIQKQIHDTKVREDAKALREKMRTEKAEQKEQEKAQRKLEREEKRIQREKDKETAKAIAREVQPQKMRDAIELEYATDESMRQALMEAGESKRTVERLKHRGLMRAIKLHGIALDRLTIKTPAEIEAIVAEKQRKADEAARGVTTPKKLFFGKINYQFAKDEGIIEAFGFDPTDTKRAIAMYKYFQKNGGITDWADIMEALEFYGYFTGSYQSGTRINGQYLSDTSEARDLDEQRVKDIVLSNQNLEKYDVVTETPEIFTDAQIHLLETEGMDILLQSGKYSEEQLKQMDYQQLNDALNQLALERAEQKLETERSTEPEDDFDIPEDWQDIADENARLDDMYPAYTAETINIDGTERSVFNSNGERLAQSEPALRNFYKWFGDSKVVDEQGRPLIVYHQTSETFNTFERGRDKAGKYDYETPGGFFFKSSDRNIGIAGNIQMPVYLKAENTITFDNRQQLQKYWAENIDGYADLLKQYQNVDKDYEARVDSIESDMDKAIDDLENSESYKNATDAQQYQMRSDLMDSFDSTALFDEWRNAANKIAEQMKQLVNDYVSANNIEMVKLENDSGAIGKKTTDSFIVFEPNQIKSVDNRGTFATEDANIYFQDLFDFDFSKEEAEVAKQILPEGTKKMKLFPTNAMEINGKQYSAINSVDNNGKKTDILKEYEEEFSSLETTYPSIEKRINWALEAYKDVTTPTDALKATIQLYIDIANERIDEEPENADEYMDMGRRLRTLLDDIDEGNVKIEFEEATEPETEGRYVMATAMPRYKLETILGKSKGKMVMPSFAMKGTAAAAYGKIGVFYNKHELKKQSQKELALYDRDSFTPYIAEEGTPEKLLEYYTKYAPRSEVENETEIDTTNGELLAAFSIIFNNLEQAREHYDQNKKEYDRTEEEETTQKIRDLVGEIAFTAESIFDTAEKRYKAKNKILQELKGLFQKWSQAKLNGSTEKELNKIISDNVLAHNKKTEKEIKSLFDRLYNIPQQYMEGKFYKNIELTDPLVAGMSLPEDEEYDYFAKKLKAKGILVVRGDVEQAAKLIYNEYQKQGRPEKAEALFFQDKPGTGKKRGAYFPELDAIARTNNADPTTLLHEFAHYFFEENMRKYNAGGGNEQWRKNWKQTIEALGVPENAGPKQWAKASETFARGYEAWLMEKEKKAKIAVDGEDKNPNEETYKQFQAHMRDIYTALTNPYFRESWGSRTGQLKPELIAWFEQQAGISTIQGKVARGEITKEEATGQVIAETVAETITGRTDVKERMIQQLHNDTSRYETPDGNVNKPRERLVALAKEIDENNVIAKGSKYDTHRNMIQVAEDADAFVRADPERAMNIINGIEPEVDGLFKEDLFTAMKRMAVQDGNMQIIEDLYQSEVANGLAKELGQRVVGFRDFTKTDDYDIMSAFNNLDRQFNKAYNTDKGKAKVTEAIAELEQEINTQDSASDAELDAILKEMECQ